MTKYIIMALMLLTNNAYSQNEILKQILENNNEIKAYEQYLKSQNAESRIGNLPLNPSVEYSHLTASDNSFGSKQELLISQQFDFPTSYFLKSDIVDLRTQTSKYQLEEFRKNVLLSAQSKLIDYIYTQNRVEVLIQRAKQAEALEKTMQIRFDKGDIGLLELKKTSSSKSIARSRLNFAKIGLKSIEAELRSMNGGKQLALIKLDYWLSEIQSDFDELINNLKSNDYRLLSNEEEKKLQFKKVTLAKSGWLPSFDIGYRQETESDINFRGINVGISIPLFENTGKVDKAESDLNIVDIRSRAYESQYMIHKRELYDKAILLKQTLDEQRSYVDKEQLELIKKSYDLRHISLTQYYIDNTIYYELIDSILELEKEYQLTLNELMIELK